MSTLIFSAMQNADEVKEFYDMTGKKLNIMISYYYLKGEAVKLIEEYKDKRGKLYLDSGAFTANKGKADFTVYEYMLYLKKYGDFFDAFLNLDDKFDDPNHNFENQKLMEKNLTNLKNKPIPVIHDKEKPLEEIRKYYENGHRYIAIGSSAGRLVKGPLDKIKSLFPDLKLHMFGNLSREMLIDFAPYSADASSYLQHARCGSIFYWDPEQKKEYVVDLGGREKGEKAQKGGGKSFHIDHFEHKDKLSTFLKDVFGYDVAEILNNETKRRMVNLYLMWQLENEILPGHSQNQEDIADDSKG